MTMSTPPHLLSAALGAGLEEGENKTKRIHNNYRNAIALQKEREERVRRVREHQEEERKKEIRGPSSTCHSTTEIS